MDRDSIAYRLGEKAAAGQGLGSIYREMGISGGAAGTAAGVKPKPGTKPPAAKPAPSATTTTPATTTPAKPTAESINGKFLGLRPAGTPYNGYPNLYESVMGFKRKLRPKVK